MTSLERAWTVVRGGVPDRVPVDLHNFLMTAEASGLPFGEFLQSGEAMAEGQLAAWRAFGHDVLLVENGTAALAEACGCEVEYPEGNAPEVRRPAIASLDELDRLRAPDPATTHPLSENLKATRIVCREVGDRAFVIGRADQGPFSLAAMVLGTEEFLLTLARLGKRSEADGELRRKLSRLLDFCFEVCCRYALAQIEQGAHMTAIGESLAGPDVCSPAMYREFEWPMARRMVDRLRSENVLLAYHICGDATAVVTDMVETGAAVLELDYKVDLRIAKDAARGRATILGPIDPSAVMVDGTPDDVTQKCREAIGILAPGGGFILGPGCALPPHTPPENVHAMVEAARKHGGYR